MENKNLDKYHQLKKQIRKNKRFILRHGRTALIYHYWNSMTTNGNFDIHNPLKFNEKLQRRKLSNNPLFVMCADKDKVREYVESKIGKKYLIPQYFSKKKIKIKDLEKLPKSFILKTSNGSGTNRIVFNKNDEDLNAIKDEVNFYTTIKYGYIWGEYYYNKIPIKIVAEKLLKDKKGNIPNDLKVHCFNNGYKKRKFIEMFYKVNGELHKNIYNENWQQIKYTYGFTSTGKKIKKPKNLDEILRICDKLSEDTNYVRVDLYNLNEEKIYFGELTFIPGAGYARFTPQSKELLWGEYMGEERVSNVK